MFPIDFNRKSLQFPSHPRHFEMAQTIQKALDDVLENHFLIFSSGTTSSYPKGYALSKEALFNNARSVNEHFNLNSDDRWGLSLPYYHVGGLSVLARAHLLGNDVIDCTGPWNPLEWARKISENQVTITTVVPTQVHDLVQNQLKAPETLRFMVVGGDHLSHAMEERALQLGWPVVRTFGMTEVCSQLASARVPGGKELVIMPHHQVKTDQNLRLFIKSTSLFTLQFALKDKLEVTWAKDLCDAQGFFPSSDLARINDRVIEPLGRIDDQIKISGRLIKLGELKDLLMAYAIEHGLVGKIELQVRADERHGKRVSILYLPGTLDDRSKATLTENLRPVIPEFEEVSDFKRTELGKLINNRSTSSS